MALFQRYSSSRQRPHRCHGLSRSLAKRSRGAYTRLPALPSRNVSKFPTSEFSFSDIFSVGIGANCLSNFLLPPYPLFPESIIIMVRLDFSIDLEYQVMQPSELV